MGCCKLLLLLVACLLMIPAMPGCEAGEPTGTPAPTPSPTATPPGSELLDSGQFVFLQGNQPVATEEFELWQTDTGLRMLSGFQMEMMELELQARLDVDTQLAPTDYELSVQIPSGDQYVRAQFEDGSVNLHIVVGNDTLDLPLTGEPPFVLLDNNLVSHYMLVHRLVQQAPADEDLDVTAVVPQATRAFPSIVRPLKPAVGSTGNATVTLARHPLRLGDLEVVYYTFGDTVVAAGYPTQQVMAYRADLYPEGLQILTTEAPEPPPEGVSETEVTFTSDGLTLAGTLALPEEMDAPVPAVVFLHGSGPVDRNESVPGLEIDLFRALAHHLAQAGIGSLRYDKRGVGESEGIFNQASMTDLLGDSLAAMAFLGASNDIDAGQLYAIGHSEGAILAPILASEGLVSGIVAISGATVHSLDWILIEQTRMIGEASGLPADVLQKQLDQTQGFIDFAKQSHSEWDDVTYEDMKEYVPELTQEGFDGYRMGMALSWWREHFLHDPLGVVQSVDVPVLIIQGEKDLQVPYTEAALYAQALNDAGNDDVALHVLPDMNHLVRYHPEDPNPEYRHLDDPVDERVLDIIVEWLLSAVVG